MNRYKASGRRAVPEHKLQHFVPRCHFKPFSIDGEGKAISLYNIALKRLVANAPLKGQCARSYFYGNDLKLEKAFQTIEGKYAEAVKMLQPRPQHIADGMLKVLRDFVQLQHFRTEAALKKLEAFHSGIAETVFDSAEERLRQGVDLSHQALVQSIMEQFIASRGYLDDLSACVVVNDAEELFVTSDDPVVLTNRFYLQRLNSSAFGIANTGAILLMPLTPRLCFLLWDGDCYSIPSRAGKVVITDDVKDIRCINEFQYQRAVSSIYISDAAYAPVVGEACEALGDRRPSFQLYTMIEVEGDQKGGRIFKPVEPAEAKEAGSFMLLAQPNYPKPNFWPSFLKWRFKVRSYNDGSAMGHMRLAHPAISGDRPRRPLAFGNS